MRQESFQRGCILLKKKGEKGNRLSADDSTIKANGSSEQCSIYYGELVKHLSKEDRNF